MNPPRGVLLGPHHYTIRTDAETRELLRAEGKLGDTHPDRHLIRIDLDGRPHTAVADTLLHEVLHAIWNQTPLDATEKLEYHEEVIIQALTPWLLGALRDNPDLVTYLLHSGLVWVGRDE